MTNGIRKDVPQQFLKFIVIESISEKMHGFGYGRYFFKVCTNYRHKTNTVFKLLDH